MIQEQIKFAAKYFNQQDERKDYGNDDYYNDMQDACKKLIESLEPLTNYGLKTNKYQEWSKKINLISQDEEYAQTIQTIVKAILADRNSTPHDLAQQLMAIR